MKILWQCATCRQVALDNQEHLCFCKPARNNPILKISYPHKRNQINPEIERRDSEINLAKTQRILAEKVRRERNKPIERQQKIEALLERIADTLDNKEMKSAV